VSSRAAFNLPELRERLSPWQLHWYPRLRSTNDKAAEQREAGELFVPAVVLAGRQTAGRGRGANSWWSARGSLTVTFALPVDEQLAPHHLPLVAGLAVRNAAAELTGSDNIQLKWPNDVLSGDRKLAGLLCARVRQAELIGVGLNVNVDPAGAPPPLRDRITSLRAIQGEEVDLTRALTTVSRHLRQELIRAASRPLKEFLREYAAHHCLLGKTVSIVQEEGEPPLYGKVEGLDEIGRLLLRSRAGLHRVISGQVQFQ
jgi:BirA family biotin operon repressor/biotin-[acetyl-CoA-carboxylase] ligase